MKASPISSSTMDFMRGFAAAYVVVNHVRGAFFVGGAAFLANKANNVTIFDYIALALLRLTSLGTEFVIMFFCVSGMAMAHASANSSSTWEFYYRRFVRIWPTYALAVFVAVAVTVGMIAVNPNNPIAVDASSLLSVPKILGMLFYVDVSSRLTPQFWSLPYEVVFYVLAPFLLVSRSWSIVWLAAAAILSVYAAAAIGLQINPADTVLENFFLNALLWFMSGAAAYNFFERIPRLRTAVFWMASAAILLSIIGIKTILGESNAISNTMMIALTLLTARNLPDRLVNFKATNWGVFSYSLYVYHYAFIVLFSFCMLEFAQIQSSLIDSYFVWIAFLPPVLLACYALYFVAERPSIMYLRGLRSQRLADAAQR